jgi:cyclopropane-fatty-acyl-phospholipid synthase
MAERGLLPDRVIRLGIHKLLRHRLAQIDPGDCQSQEQAKAGFIEQMKASPIALHTQEANDQHYELPPALFEQVLGEHLKYSCCYYENGATSLDRAEAAMLELYGERAELRDGQEILELGCGWGSFTLWLAARFPQSRVTAVSNSALQREFIESRARARGLENVRIITGVRRSPCPSAQVDGESLSGSGSAAADPVAAFSRNRLTSPVQPVWWLAPSPWPVSAWKYSKKWCSASPSAVLAGVLAPQ